MKKYTLQSDTRIRALRDFGNVKAGDLGGFIGSERNLSHDGLCWVGGDACVYEDARVSENALVTENARVYGDAQVTGNARVYGDAWVGGDARVYGAQLCDNAWVSGNARVTGFAHVYGNAQVYGAQLCDNARVSENARVSGFAHVYGNAQVYENAWVFGSAQVGGTLHVGGGSRVIDNEIFCKIYLDLPSLKDAADPVNKDRLLRALLTIYKENPGWWSVQIGLFIDYLRQQGMRYQELAAIQKSCKSY